MYSLHQVVQLAVTDNIGGKPVALDTYRKVVDNAPRICDAAVEELTAFWSRMKRAKLPKERR